MSHLERNRFGIGALTALAAIITMSRPASAQETAEGIALDRFEPSERGSYWFSADSLDIRGQGRPAIGAVIDYGHAPLVAYEADDEVDTLVIGGQLFGHLGMSLVAANRLRLGVNLPILIYQDGNDVVVNNLEYRYAYTGGLGDLRLAADLRLAGKFGGPATLALGTTVHAPTGDRDSYAGDGKARISPRLQLAGEALPFVYALRVGVIGRFQDDDFAGHPYGPELDFGAAMGFKVANERLVFGPELAWATTLIDDAAFRRRNTPAELLFGLHYNVAEDWRIGAGAGPGLSRGTGTPDVRVVASIEWAPAVKEKAAPEEPDTDGDGILDRDDACPKEAGVPNEDPALNGCPAPVDTDGDGIVDKDDACPKEAGVPNADPRLNGCPEVKDRDGAGVPDAEDACPDEAGVAEPVDSTKNGCPLPKDRDGDGILDPDDACPDQAGVANPDDPKKHGCPKVIVERGEIRILERIEFDTGKATIRPESDAILEAVRAVLAEHPEIKKVEVQGHTDNKGAAYYNKTLSQQRAASVVKWLTSKGIEGSRLVPVGYGLEKPIDSNDTEEGRQNNRRVQFVILEGEPTTTEER